MSISILKKALGVACALAGALAAQNAGSSVGTFESAATSGRLQDRLD